MVAVALLTTVVAGCSDDTGSSGSGATTSTSYRPPDRGNRDGTLALGQLAPLTGRVSSIADSITAPVRIAVDEINAADGVNGKPVTLQVADDGGGENPPVAAQSLDSLIGDHKVDAVIGPTATGTALDLLTRIRAAGVLECSGSNSAEELSDATASGYYFRTAPPDRLQAVALARLVTSAGKRRPVVLVRDDAYGDAFVGPLRRELTRAEAAPAAVIRYDPDAKDLTSVARRAAREDPDAVVAISLTHDGARLVRGLGRANIGPGAIPMYVPDGMQSTTFHTEVDPQNPGAVRGIVGTSPAAAPSGPDSAFTAAMRRAGVPPIFSAYYYDCAVLTALAAERAGTDDPAKMRRSFAQNLRGETDCSTFAACKQALEAGDTIHYRGASSPFDRWAGNEPGQGTYDVWSYGPNGAVVTGPAEQQIRVP